MVSHYTDAAQYTSLVGLSSDINILIGLIAASLHCEFHYIFLLHLNYYFGFSM